MKGTTKNASSDLTRIPWLSSVEMLILELLIARGEMYGLQLVNESDGRLKRGSVYVTLNRMEEKGYVAYRTEVSAPIEGGMRRPLYRCTGYGERVYRAWQAAKYHMAPTALTS